jgi:acyl carrier protein
MSELNNPLAELRQQVASVWQAVLKVDTLGLHDNFFELGGQSLQAMRVSVELKNRYGLEVPAIAVFQTATVAELADYIAATAPAAGLEYGSV